MQGDGGWPGRGEWVGGVVRGLSALDERYGRESSGECMMGALCYCALQRQGGVSVSSSRPGCLWLPHTRARSLSLSPAAISATWDEALLTALWRHRDCSQISRR
jgi:hypothetical protein